MESDLTPNEQVKVQSGDDEIDLNDFLQFFLRNKKLISIIGSVGLLFGISNAIKVSQSWKGTFQIVISNSDDTGSSQVNKSISNLLDSKNIALKNGLLTQVEILKSPSVLMPVFNYVKERKGIDNDDWRYKTWFKRNIIVELLPGTSILDITYEDSDKSIILPALNQISEAYQQYSGKATIEGIDRGIKYLNTQINVYKQKSLDSQNRIREFSIDNGLPVIFVIPEIKTQSRGSISSLYNKSINASNEINRIDDTLTKLNKFDNDINSFVYFASTFSSNNDQNETLKTLSKLDEELAILRSNFKENDKVLINKLRQKELVFDLLKKQTYGYLKARRLIESANLKNSLKPKEVLFKYEELLRDAMRDKFTLNQLKDNLLSLSLNKAKEQKPWELITQPTIIKNSILFNRQKEIAVGLIGGLIIGILTSLGIEVKKKTIYSKKVLEKQINYPLLIDLNTAEDYIWNEQVSLLASKLNNEVNNGTISIIPIGNLNRKSIDKLSRKLRESLQENKLIISDDLASTKESSKQILIASLGITTSEEINNIKQRLIVQGTSIEGWILIE